MGLAVHLAEGSRQSFVDKDNDKDGVARCQGDCDDNDPLRYPGNEEEYGSYYREELASPFLSGNTLAELEK